MILEGRLIVRVRDRQRAAVRRSVVFFYGRHAVRQAARRRVVPEAKPIVPAVRHAAEQMVVRIAKAPRDGHRGLDPRQVPACVCEALRGQLGRSRPTECDFLQHAAAPAEIVDPSGSVRKPRDLFPRSVINRDTALCRLIVADAAQAAVRVKIALVVLFVRDAVFFVSAARGRQGQALIDLIFIGAAGLVLEVMPRAVLVLPYIIGGIRRKGIDQLVIAAAPAVTHSEGIIILVVGVIDVLDCRRHSRAGKAKTVRHPNEIAGILADIARTRRTGADRGIIPIALQTAVVDIGDIQHRQRRRAVVRRAKLRPLLLRRVLHGIRHFEEHTVIAGLVPLLRNVRDVPRIPAGILHHQVILYPAVIVRAIAPLERPGVPAAADMVHIYLRAFGGFLQLIQGDAGLHHHIRRCKRRKIHILHIEPLHAVGRVVARLDHAPQVVEILTGSHRLILNVLRPQIRLHDGIQHHRIRALRRIHPLLRQQIRQLIRPRRLLRQLHLNLIVIPPVCVVEIRGRHVKYGRLAVGAHGVHASVLLQRQGQLPCLQKITIALT